MPKRLFEGGPVYKSDVHPKQKIADAIKGTDKGDLADLDIGFGYARSRVQARLGDNNARKIDSKYPKPSGKQVPKD